MARVLANTQIFEYPLIMVKRFLIFIGVLLFPFLVGAQIQGEAEVYLTGDRIDATFRGGGLEKFDEFINNVFDYRKVTK